MSELDKDLNLKVEQKDKIEIPLDPRLKDCPPVKPPKIAGTIDPLDGITKEEEYECIKKAVDKVKRTHDKELSLLKSDVRMPNQEFMVCSFVGPKQKQKTDQCGIKVWGVCPDMPSARKWAQYINNIQENKDFDVYVLEMYAWCLIPPDPEACQDQEYHDKRLDTLIRQHKAQVYKTKEVFDTRTKKLAKNNHHAEKAGVIDPAIQAHNENYVMPTLPQEKNYNPAIQDQLDSNRDNVMQRNIVMPSEPLPEFTFERVNPGDPDYMGDSAHTGVYH